MASCGSKRASVNAPAAAVAAWLEGSDGVEGQSISACRCRCRHGRSRPMRWLRPRAIASADQVTAAVDTSGRIVRRCADSAAASAIQTAPPRVATPTATMHGRLVAHDWSETRTSLDLADQLLRVEPELLEQILVV